MHLNDLALRLEELRGQSLLREPDDTLVRAQMMERFGEDFIDAASNDYLDLVEGMSPRKIASVTQITPRDDIVSRETHGLAEPALQRASSSLPTGARASRLVFGTHPEHLALEQELAVWAGYPNALLFASGYAANVGSLGALLSKEDAVFSDALNHASLIDGIRLSGAKARVYPHLDLRKLETQLEAAQDAPARWIISESYYSMDGDGPDLEILTSLAKRYDAHLYLDEAHAVGTFGRKGRGLCDDTIKPAVVMAAFGKAFGAHGAAVLTSTEVRTWLWNRARSFVFSTAPSPLLAGEVREQLKKVQGAEALRARLEGGTKLLRRQLASRRELLVPGSFGPIVSLVLGSAERALLVAARLRDEGILAQAIRPPTVPEGQSRLRLVLRAEMSPEQIGRISSTILRLLKELELIKNSH